MLVHLDGGGPYFCESNQDGRMTRDESEVTCPECLERLVAIDKLAPRARVPLATAAKRIDWFGGD